MLPNHFLHWSVVFLFVLPSFESASSSTKLNIGKLDVEAVRLAKFGGTNRSSLMGINGRHISQRPDRPLESTNQPQNAHQLSQSSLLPVATHSRSGAPSYTPVFVSLAVSAVILVAVLAHVMYLQLNSSTGRSAGLGGRQMADSIHSEYATMSVHDIPMRSQRVIGTSPTNSDSFGFEYKNQGMLAFKSVSCD